MNSWPTLGELIQNDPESRKLFEAFPPDAQVALQEQRQNIHTREELKQVAASFQLRSAD